MTTGQRFVWALLGLSLLGGLVTGAQIYYRLAYVWGVFLLVNWVWARLSLRGLQFERRARALRAQLGQVFEERFEVRNPSRLLRFWLEVEDLSALPGAQASQVFSAIGGREGRSYVARTRLVQRGAFALGPTRLGSGDLFGLFPVSRTIAPQATLLVYPLIVPLTRFAEPTGIMPGGDALRRRTPQVTPNASGVREYLPGDPLNRIHWRSTARREMLMVKEFELDPLADVWLFLDAEQRVHCGLPFRQTYEKPAVWNHVQQVQLPPTTEEYAASIAASLMRYYLQQKRAVGLVSRAAESLLLPADRGGRQLVKALDELALWHPTGMLPLISLVEAQARHLTRGSTVVLITPSPEDSIAVVTDYLKRRGLRPIVVLLDSESFGGAPGSKSLAQKIRLLDVPVRRVMCGESLEANLTGEN